MESAQLDKSADRVKRMFASIAPRYDLLNHLLSLNIDRLWRRFTVKKLRLDSDAPVLDACTGTGDLALAIAAKGGGKFRVIGTDFCFPMLEIARRKAEPKSSPFQHNSSALIQFMEADTMQLPFASDTFQAVTVAFGLRNVANTIAGVKEMIRVAKPGGQVAILEFSEPTLPGLKQLYSLYFRRILPMIGQKIASNDSSAYKYLPESVGQFPCGEQLAKLLRESGLKDIELYPLTFGIATLYLGRK